MPRSEGPYKRNFISARSSDRFMEIIIELCVGFTLIE